MAAAGRFITFRSLSAYRFLIRRSSLVCFSRCHCVQSPSQPAALSSLASDGLSLRRFFLFGHLDRSFITAGFSAAKQHHQLHAQAQYAVDSVPHLIHHSPEWSSFFESLSAAGYFNSASYADYDFVPHFPEEFLAHASACLDFARKRPNFLGLLTKSDIEVVVLNGMPFLFKNGEESAKNMRLYLSSGVHHLLGTDKPSTVDLMKLILSYVCDVACSAQNNVCNRELVDLSVRNLLSELTKLSHGIPDSSLSRSMPNQLPSAYGQTDHPFRQNIEMKRGDWICPRCKFMNFARNMKCLECEEARPKRQLNPGEWECPECDFFNHRGNTLCSRCDFKRPEENISLRLVKSISGSGGSRLNDDNHSSNNNLEKKLADNEEKAQRWFSKLSQMGSNPDMNSTVDDEDFPDIMPLRKGTNKFVLSRRKSPLERRLSNSGQYELNSGTKNYQVGEDSSFNPVGDTSNSVKSEKPGDFENQHTSTSSWDSGNTWRTTNDYTSATNGSQAWNPQPLQENSSKSGIADTSASNGSQAWNPRPLWENSSKSGIADTGMRTTGQSFQNTFENQSRTTLSKGFPVPDQENAIFAGNGSPSVMESPYSNSYNVGTSRNGCPSDGNETRFSGISSQNSRYNSQPCANTSWSNGYSYNARSAATATQKFGNSSPNSHNPHWDHEYSHQGNTRINDTETKVVGDWSRSPYNPQTAGNPTSSYTVHHNETNTANMGWVSGYSTGNHYKAPSGPWNSGYSGNVNASGVSNCFVGSPDQPLESKNNSYTTHQNESNTANMGRFSGNSLGNYYNASTGSWNTSGVSNSFVGSSNQPLDSKNDSYTFHQNETKTNTANMAWVPSNSSGNHYNNSPTGNHYNSPTGAWNTSGVSSPFVGSSNQPLDSKNNSYTIHQNETKTNTANMAWIASNSSGNHYHNAPTAAWNTSGVSDSFVGSSHQPLDSKNNSYTIHQNVTKTNTSNMAWVPSDSSGNHYNNSPTGNHYNNSPTGAWNTSGVSNPFVGSSSQPLDSKTNSYTIHQNETKTDAANMAWVPSNSSGNYYNNAGAWNTSGVSDSFVGSSHQPLDSKNIGKSLEGSGVKEADALDMSEEAKAERWFKRVANIKDISELSQIPDEDFPSIMPMRKGVNRFVVSKRKTPLERRLTSQQSRRNVPTVSSHLEKKEDDEF